MFHRGYVHVVRGLHHVGLERPSFLDGQPIEGGIVDGY